MTALVKDILAQLNLEAPFALAEKWDNVGLMVGNPEREVKKVLIGLDTSTSLVEEAVEKGADTILTHHPAIFKPLSSIDTSLPEGKLLETAITHGISIIACHTNLDSATYGVSDILAEKIGLSQLKPLLPAADEFPDAGLGRIGTLNPPLSGDTFLTRVMEALNLPTLQIAGPLPDSVEKVAVCGGSGSDFAITARKQQADVYITAEVKHNIARWAEEYRFCIIEGTHYGTEQPSIQLMAQKLRQVAEHNGWQLDILETETEKHPFRYIQKIDLTT